MRRFLPQPILSLVLLVSWLILTNSIAPGSIVMGAILGLMVPWVTHRFWEVGAKARHYPALIGYLGTVLIDIIHANFVVARQILGSNRALRSQMFELELELTGALPISLLAATITLTPGTVSCRMSQDQRKLWVHALHTEDPVAEITDIKQRYEARLQHIFGQPVTADSRKPTTSGAKS